MKAIVPTQEIVQTGVQFPIEGEHATAMCCVIAMELFGASKAEVARQIGGTIDDVDAICCTDEYVDIKNSIIDNVRKLDQRTLSGRIMQQANDAFDRMVELSEGADREDVKYWANKDIMDRAMMTSAAAQADELTITFKKRG